MPGAGTQGQRGWSSHLRQGEMQPLRRTPHWTYTVSTGGAEVAHTGTHSSQDLAEGLSLGIASSTLTSQSLRPHGPNMFPWHWNCKVGLQVRQAWPSGDWEPSPAVPVSLGHHCSLTCNPSTHGPAPPPPQPPSSQACQTDFRPVLD